MPSRPELTPRPENNFTRFIKYFTLIMALIYPALGLYLLFSESERVSQLDPKLRLGLGIVLILYGMYRFWRSYKQYFKSPRNDRRGEL